MDSVSHGPVSRFHDERFVFLLFLQLGGVVDEGRVLGGENPGLRHEAVFVRTYFGHFGHVTSQAVLPVSGDEEGGGGEEE